MYSAIIRGKSYQAALGACSSFIQESARHPEIARLISEDREDLLEDILDADELQRKEDITADDIGGVNTSLGE